MTDYGMVWRLFEITGSVRIFLLYKQCEKYLH